MHQPAAHDFGAGRAGEVVFEVGDDPVALPKGQCANVRRSLRKIGDDGVTDVDGLGQMADQRLEKLLARAGGRPFDDRSEARRSSAIAGATAPRSAPVMCQRAVET